MADTGAEPVAYFDGTSSRRHAATLAFADALEIIVDGETRAKRRQRARHAARELPERAGAGAAGNP
jgi:hypothetical protein